MKKLSMGLIAMALTGSAFADTLKWDFESPARDKEWLAWGTKQTDEATPERLAEIVTYSTEKPHEGTRCLVLRDQLSTFNPYMVLAKPIAILPDVHYAFAGFVRSNSAVAEKFKVGIEAETKDGKFLGWVAMETFDTSREWTRFQVKVGELPPGTECLRLAVFSHTAESSNPTATGEIFLDDLIFGEVGTDGL